MSKDVAINAFASYRLNDEILKWDRNRNVTLQTQSTYNHMGFVVSYKGCGLNLSVQFTENV